MDIDNHPFGYAIVIATLHPAAIHSATNTVSPSPTTSLQASWVSPGLSRGLIKCCFDFELDAVASQSFLSTLRSVVMAVDHEPSSTSSDPDAEKANLADSGGGSPHGSLKRHLKNRHISMIT